MPPPSSRPKPRFALFSVGQHKTSPARAASTKRASLRHSALRAEALKLQLPAGLANAGRDLDPEAQREDGGAERSARVDTPPANGPAIPTYPLHDADDTPMKNTALPPIPTEPPAHASSSSPRPSAGSSASPGTARPSTSASSSRQAAAQTATMPSQPAHSSQRPGPHPPNNLFKPGTWCR
ncbi:hypothetical protein FKP32DRAFT_972834 [Trametes sanguinea]|nr:hypothetical protein FKP32DRAFT_972834 [Trametes sanguinea]